MPMGALPAGTSSLPHGVKHPVTGRIKISKYQLSYFGIYTALTLTFIMCCFVKIKIT